MSLIFQATKWQSLLTSLILIFYFNSSYARELILEPSINLVEYITDNISLESGNMREGDIVTIFTPGLYVNRQLQRLELTANYQLEGMIYKNNSEDNRLLNLFDGSLSGEIFKDRFFIDVSGSTSEQNINNSGTIGVDNASLSDARSRIYTYRISPNWQEQIGTYLDTEIRFERNGVESSQSLDSHSDNILVNVSSGSIFTNILWGITYQDEKIKYQTDDPTRFKNLSGYSEYVVTPKLSFKVNGGYDDNTYANSNGNIDGYHWRLGGVFRPSRRTFLEASAGKRFFGTDIFIEMGFQARQVQSNLSFYRKPETTRGTLLQIQTFPLTDEFGNPVLDTLTGEQRTIDVSLPEQTTEVYINESIRWAMSYKLRKNVLDLIVFKNNINYELNSRDQNIFGIDMKWNYQLNRLTRVSLSFQYNLNEITAGDEQIFKIFGYTLARTIGDGINVSLNYRYTDVNSTNPLQTYTQNLFTVNGSKDF